VLAGHQYLHLPSSTDSGKAFSTTTFESRVRKQTCGCFGEGSFEYDRHRLQDSISLSHPSHSHQRFFLQLVLACKVEDCTALAKQALSESCAVVIGLFSTGESHLDNSIRELEDIISAPRAILEALIERYFPTKTAEGKERQQFWRAKLDTLSLPGNALDQLIDKLGGESAVAEMTGRTKRYLRRGGDGMFILTSRDPKSENLSERYETHPSDCKKGPD